MSDNGQFHTVIPIVTTDENGEMVTTILIDGMYIKALLDYTIQHHAPGLARVSIEFYAEVKPEPLSSLDALKRP